MDLPEIDLPKLAGVAGSAVALIIATAILLSWITARYVPAFDRYRALAGELRGYGDQNKRRHSLREQTLAYQKRLCYLSRASQLLSMVMICAIVTILSASLTILLPNWRMLSYLGAGTLLAALVLDVVAVRMVMIENRVDRRMIDSEIMDLDELHDQQKHC